MTRLWILPSLALLCGVPGAVTGPSLNEAQQAVATVEVLPDSMPLQIGDIGRATCYPRNQFGALLTNTCTWVSRDTTVAKPTSGSQVSSVTARKIGKAWVVATAKGKRDSVRVVVTDTTTPPPPPPPPAGITIAPGESWQAKVNANPINTTFRILAGTHLNQQVLPKSGDRFIGDPGAIMDGGGTTTFAFYPGEFFNFGASWPSNVVIRGLKIQRYNPPFQFGAISIGGDENWQGIGGVGWWIDSTEVTENATGGIRIGPSTHVSNSNVHHNHAIGIVGVGNDVLIENTEIAFNDYLMEFPPSNEAGGTKFKATNRLIVRNNFVHHNYGPGLWTDIDNVNVLYENNRVEDNAGMGIFHEISYAAIIRNNIVKRNATSAAAHPWFYGAGIMISSSGDTEVYGNTVEGNGNAITGVQQNVGSGTLGPRLLKNVNVHNNTITSSACVAGGGGVTGVGQDVGDPTIFTTRNIHFENNTYHLPVSTSAACFGWADGWRTAAQWRAYGHDDTGTFFHDQ